MANETQLSSRCPLCNAVFQPAGAEILDESQQGILFHLTCPSCRSSLLAVVAASKLGLSSFGMVTDLTATDVRRLRRSPAITQEDVLQAYEEINHLNGTFGEAFTHGKHLAQR
ncbi:MAG: hypothetical protein U0514_02685 [Candidatus Andersenbacteria bacterium]